MEITVADTKCLTKFLLIAVLCVALVLMGLFAQTNQAHAATYHYTQPLPSGAYSITERAIPFVFLDPEDKIFVPIPGTMQGSVGWRVAHTPEAS